MNNRMNTITIIIPVHKIDAKYLDMMQEALNNTKNLKYDGQIKTMFVLPEGYDEPVLNGWNSETDSFVNNPGKTDYCSQVNYGVTKVDTEYFTIMECDDRFNNKWFTMFNNYLPTNENVSIFMPINVVHNVKTNEREFVNHIAWSTGFATSDENENVGDNNNVGYITFNSLQDTASFNLTGSIFKTSDWLGYKPSIKISFNYEYLLRATNKHQKVFVIPKEGYYHEVFRDDSLTQEYMDTISDSDVTKWFELAKREYSYDEDRNNGIICDTQDTLK